MNVDDLQDDDYDEYDEYGEVDDTPAPGGTYQSQPSYLPELQPESMARASASFSQPAAPGDFSQPAQSAYSPPADSYKPQSNSSPPAGGSSYGGSGYGGSGIDNMSSMGSSLPSASPPAPASKYGGGDKCPRCNKTVYFAEAKEGPNNIKYHRPCFSCLLCKKVLDSTFTERQGEVYCKVCYGKEFGPKGFGYGASVQSTPDATPSPESRPNVTYNPSPPVQKTWNQNVGGSGGSSSSNNAYGGSGGNAAPKAAPRFGGGDKCGRCGKTVYFAEAREGPNNIKYHKTCFTCLTCNKSLDSHFAERKGDLYCKPCYGKDFGPSGFGFAGVSSPPPAAGEA